MGIGDDVIARFGSDTYTGIVKEVFLNHELGLCWAIGIELPNKTLLCVPPCDILEDSFVPADMSFNEIMELGNG